MWFLIPNIDRVRPKTILQGGELGVYNPVQGGGGKYNPYNLGGGKGGYG